LQHLSEQEFASLVGAEDRLRAAGILRSNGMVDYSVAIEILRRSLQDPYLKSLLLKFVAEHFREDLRKLLSLSVYGVKMLWSEDFERFLAERKKRRKVRAQDTLQYYKSLFLRFLEGKELSEQLIDYVINHKNRWLRNVFRHYIQYLYHKRLISPETFGWIMEVVPSRGYKLDVRPYQINLDDVVKALQYLKQHHEKYYLIYRLMLEGGLRLSHAVHIVKTFNPKEVVEIPEIHLETPRLVCFNDKGFCRYYAGIRGSQKPCEWAYLSIETLELLKRFSGDNIDRRTVTRYAIRHSLLAPKYMRKVSWRLMIKVMPREVARFVQSRFGELKISEARYEDLLSEADNYYPKYLEKLRELVYSSHMQENREQYTSSQ
jgi:intergrase/recombinase